ncbi:hypothetical protein CsatB_030189 [Cannabis sativa]
MVKSCYVLSLNVFCLQKLVQKNRGKLFLPLTSSLFNGIHLFHVMWGYIGFFLTFFVSFFYIHMHIHILILILIFL